MNPAFVEACRAQIERLVEAYPELRDDEDFRRDVFEAQTNLDQIIWRLGVEYKTLKAEAAGLKTMSAEIADKAAKKLLRSEAVKSAMAGLLDAAGLPGLKLNGLSVSFQPVAASVVITDEAALPDRFIRIKRDPDKAALRDALKSGAAIPGAQLSNGGRALRVM